MVRDTNSFIQKSMEIHGDRYDYSLVSYINTRTPVKIICPEHGVFEQKPMNHIQGYGCRKCYGLKKRIYSLVDGKRQCSACKQYLDPSEFHANNVVSDGLESCCKKCGYERKKKSNSKKVETAEEKHLRYARKWALWKEKHKDEINARKAQREASANERKANAKLARRIRAYIRDSIKSDAPRPHMKELLGCSIPEFKEYISTLFQEGMTWENNTPDGWHLDHIRPVASFIHLKDDVNEQLECFHYTNYQPLWARDNMSKGSLYNGERHRYFEFNVLV